MMCDARLLHYGHVSHAAPCATPLSGRMAPLHHHFELGGMSEPVVVRLFVAVSIALLALTLGFHHHGGGAVPPA